MTTSEPRHALVTGAARRIGRAIALDLARHGWPVTIHHHHSESEARALAAEIESGGGRAALVRADLAREEESAAVIEHAEAALGPVTCVVHNASAFMMDTVDSATRATWDLHLETNLRAPFVITQAFAQRLPPGVEGNVIHLLDERVWRPTPAFVSYTVSKAGLWMLTRSLALALAPRIRVNAIGPGATLRSPRQTEAHFARQWAAAPLARGTTPEEICEAVRFILGARSMTGQMIALDGGQHLAWAMPTEAAPPASGGSA
jgi:NAD(P)-dependent dehydrogenase (short-subunit alcohol dehydrogenase family)